MKQITINGRTLLFVEVPEDIILRTISISGDCYLLFRTEKCSSTWSHIKIPQASYQFLGLTDTITDEQATLIFPKTKETEEYYESYYIPVETGDLPVFPTAKIAFNNFLEDQSITGRQTIIEVL